MSTKSYTFCEDQFATVGKMIEAGQATSIIGIPGSGISVFLKQLALQPFGKTKTVYIDVFSLPALSTQEFFSELLEQLGGAITNKTTVELVRSCIDAIKKAESQKIVIIIGGFDKLSKEFSTDFFRYIRSLDRPNVTLVFGICKRLETILPAELNNLDLRLLANIYYLKRYTTQDFRFLLDTYGPSYQDVDPMTFDELVRLSGGHFQLMQLLLQSEHRQEPVTDPFIKLCFENIWSHLSAAQKGQLRKVAAGKPVSPDQYLTKVGLVVEKDGQLELFSPLIAECVKAFSTPKLPLKERRLFSILKRNQGRLVGKRELFDAVWPGQAIGSEWALNALIYRLRKHPAFLGQKYTIESYKKLGYKLVKI